MRRQFPAALKLNDRALEILPNDADLRSVKASIYQAEGDLAKAAKLLSTIPSDDAFIVKMTQLRIERNHAEAIRLLEARAVQFHFASEIDKGTNQVILAFARCLAGDKAGAKAAAEEARNIIEPLCKNQPENSFFAQQLALRTPRLGRRTRPWTKRNVQSFFYRAPKIGYPDPPVKKSWR